jgi:hypothetical protein
LFDTFDRLTPGDHDDSLDVYDARIGGRAAPSSQSSPPRCSGDECQGESTPSPTFPVAATDTLHPAHAVRRAGGIELMLLRPSSAAAHRFVRSGRLPVRLRSRGLSGAIRLQLQLRIRSHWSTLDVARARRQGGSLDEAVFLVRRPPRLTEHGNLRLRIVARALSSGRRAQIVFRVLTRGGRR